MSLSASIVICAYTEDRWLMLSDAVASALRQTHQPQQVVVVVDHNPRLFNRCMNELSTWQKLGVSPIAVLENRFASRLGGARNTGSEICESDVIAFLDDDATAEADWLGCLLKAYDDERVVAVGGAPLPVYETSRPYWFPPQMDWVYGCHYEGLPTTLSPTRRLIGASMSVRSSALSTIGGFQSDNHDDMVMCHQLAAKFPHGWIMLEPRAIVRHNVIAERVTWSYFWKRCFSVNRSKAKELTWMGDAASTAADREFILGSLKRSGKHAAREASRGHSQGAVHFLVLVAGIAIAGAGFVVGALQHRLAR